MRHSQQLWHWTGVLLGTLIVLVGCTYDAAIQRLSLDEQAELYTYRQVMTPSQVRTYLAKGTAAERTAYLSQVGLAQRFQALDPVDRGTVLSGMPRTGMSAEALLFIWGEPDYTDGDARRYAHWHYLGSSFNRGTYGYHNPALGFGSRVDVYLVDGHVVGWVDYPPTSNDGGHDERRN